MGHPFHLPRTPGLLDKLSCPSSKEAVNSESRPQILMKSAQVWGMSHVSPTDAFVYNSSFRVLALAMGVRRSFLF